MTRGGTNLKAKIVGENVFKIELRFVGVFAGKERVQHGGGRVVAVGLVCS